MSHPGWLSIALLFQLLSVIQETTLKPSDLEQQAFILLLNSFLAERLKYKSITIQLKFNAELVKKKKKCSFFSKLKNLKQKSSDSLSEVLGSTAAASPGKLTEQ